MVTETRTGLLALLIWAIFGYFALVVMVLKLSGMVQALPAQSACTPPHHSSTQVSRSNPKVEPFQSARGDFREFVEFDCQAHDSRLPPFTLTFSTAMTRDEGASSIPGDEADYSDNDNKYK